jgi:hypothetical protein
MARSALVNVNFDPYQSPYAADPIWVLQLLRNTYALSPSI